MDTLSNSLEAQKESKVELDQDFPIFDLEDLQHRLGDEELIKEILHTMLNEMPKQIEQLISAVQLKHNSKIIQQAHKIKGTAANTGGIALSQQASKIEQAARNDLHDHLIIESRLLESCFLQLKQEILQFTD